MSWRHIMISNPAKLSVRQSQLVIQQENIVTIPLQDIATILIESQSVNITTSLLSACSDYRISIIVCDGKHIPNGMLMSYHQHSRQLTVLQMQNNLSKPFKKRVWQQIVIQKIINQSKCLEFLGKENVEKLNNIVKTVESGDKTNRESYAARIYFTSLFGETFTRRSDDSINRLLNYGYSIMRGIVARSIVKYGFTPCLGIHHDSQTNAYNLADDFMEVLRPIVDLYAVNCDPEIWNVQTRANLVNLSNMEIELNNKKYTVTTAVDEMIKSFIAACRQLDHKYLKLPELLRLKLHETV